MKAEHKTTAILATLCVFAVAVALIVRSSGTRNVAAEQSEESGTVIGVTLPVSADAEEMGRGEPVEKLPEGLEQREQQPYAISGERIYRFASREELNAYLAALRAEGLRDRGVIPVLVAVRVADGVARRLDPTRFGAEGEDNLWSSRPFPVEAIPAAQLAGLRGFGSTAGELAGLSGRADGSGVIVAVLDNGVDPDFEGNQFRGVWVDYVGGEGNFSHGTSVASIIAGPIGVAPQAILLSIRVLDEGGVGNSFDLARGIIEATDLGAQIINMSLGTYGESRLLMDAIAYASERGVLMVAAAGNEGKDRLPMPAADPRVLAVTAVDANRSHPGFPNRHPDIAMAAPGVGVVSVADGEIILFSGTSAAAPFVSGTLAALLSENAALAPESAVRLLRESLDDAGPPGPDALFGGGTLSWTRLQRRNQNNLVDIALADIHVDPGARPGQNAAVLVTVQNQGTAWIAGAHLTVQVGQRGPQQVPIGSLDAGAVAVHRIFVDLPAAGAPPLTVAALVELTGIRADVDPSNNFRARGFSFPE